MTEVRYFTVAEVAALVKKSAQTVKRWAKAGKIPRGRKLVSSKQIVFTEAEVELIRKFAMATVTL